MTPHDQNWWEAIAAADGLVSEVESFRNRMIEISRMEKRDTAELVEKVEQLQAALESIKQGLEGLGK